MDCRRPPDLKTDWSGLPDQIYFDTRQKSGADSFPARQNLHNPIILWRKEDVVHMGTDNSPNPAQEAGTAKGPTQRDMTEYIEERYKRQIDYYWKAGATNKKTYKFNRSLVIILGATVTLLSSLTSAVFVENNPVLKLIFGVGTPALAALLTIINGFIQSFQSGASWRDMVLNAERLEKERDRFRATPEKEKDSRKELDVLNSIVLTESSGFFRRILDSEPQPEIEEDEDKSN